MKFMINVLYGCFWHEKRGKRQWKKILFIIEKFFIFSPFSHSNTHMTRCTHTWKKLLWMNHGCFMLTLAWWVFELSWIMFKWRGEVWKDRILSNKVNICVWLISWAQLLKCLLDMRWIEIGFECSWSIYTIRYHMGLIMVWMVSIWACWLLFTMVYPRLYLWVWTRGDIWIIQ